MNLTFGDHLMQFVQAVDIVDNDIKDSILEEIEVYLKDELGIKYFTLLVETLTETQTGTKVRGLRTTEWLRGGDPSVSTLFDDQDNYLGQAALAFDQNISLWIVSNSGMKELKSSEKYIDLWSGKSSEEIPKYLTRTGFNILTSVIIPLISNELERSFGVINFESERYLKYSEPVRDELTKIARSISKLYERNIAYSKLRTDTKGAIRHLNKVRNNNVLSVVNQRKLFIASSGRADNEVIGLIREVLDQYDVEVVFWKEMSETGVINKQILTEIRACRYGICYLSEIVGPQKASDSQFKYQDNPNVLIEAGMLYAKSQDFNNVIPIREESSEKIPFDIAANRILVVPRIKDGKLNQDSFKKSLSSSLDIWFNPA